MTIREFLPPADYKKYRNVRAAALMFVVVGALLTLAGLIMMAIEPQNGSGPPPLIVCLLLSALGLCGVIGGIATLAAHPKWSRFAYVMGAFYLFAFPLGTILSAVLLTGLGGYLENVRRYRAQTVPSVAR